MHCNDLSSLRERTATYTKAYNVFFKIWEDNWGPWLQLILQNTLWAFIENPEYTLAEVPIFLNPRNTAFRDYIISNIKHNPAVADFWRYEFFQRRERDQQERVDAALTRITTLLTHPYVRHIISQKGTAISFDAMLRHPVQKIVLFKLSANLAPDIKKFIGTILLSELLYAVRNRAEGNRSQLCVFVDEFQNFTTSEDIRSLITEGRKFGSAITFGHQERYGQFADNQKLMGATLAAVNKVVFQSTVKDAEELAPEFAKEPTTTETRLEPELVTSQEPLNDLLRRGHANRRIQELVNVILRPIQAKLERVRDRIEGARIERAELIDQATIYQDHAAIDRIDAQMERYIGGDSLANAMSAIDNAMAFHTQARNVTEDIKAEFQDYQEIKDSIHRINRHLNALMEGRLSPEPGDEEYVDLFMNVLFAGYDVDVPLRGVYFLYLQLRFGKPNLPRSIPPFLAMKYFWEELVREYRQIHTQRYEEVRKKSGNSPIPSFDELQALSPLEEGVLRKERVIIKYHEEPSVLDMLFQSRMFKLDFQFQLRRFLDKNKDTGLPVYLPQLPYRVLPPDEIERLTKLCYTELLHDPVTGKKRIEKLLFPDELDELCHLLQNPENHIKVPSGQYITKQVHVRPVHDMTDEMAQELAKLPRFTAWTTLVDENEGKQTVRQKKIHTLPLPEVTPKTSVTELLKKSYDLCMKRTEIEEEIRKRQEKWRTVTPQSPTPPPKVPAPPTKF